MKELMLCCVQRFDEIPDNLAHLDLQINIT
jgi:hypothetical protein